MSSAIRPRPMRRRTVPALGMALGMATVLALSACSSSGGSGNSNPGSSGGNVLRSFFAAIGANVRCLIVSCPALVQSCVALAQQR